MFSESQNQTQDPSGGNRSGDSRRVPDPSLPAVGDSQEVSQGLSLVQDPWGPGQSTSNLSPDTNHFSV